MKNNAMNKWLLFFSLIIFQLPVTSQTTQKYRWQRILEGGGGATCMIWFHPEVPDEMIISGDVGGPWHWNRENKKWDYLTDFSALLEDHCNAQIVYDWSDKSGNTFLMHNAGFGTIGYGRQNHFYLTRDGGKTFEKGNNNITGKTSNFRMELMKGDPYNSKIIYYAGINGIDISFDQGMNFETLKNQPIHTVSTKYWDKQFNTGSEMVWVDGKAGSVTDTINNRKVIHARRLIVTQITPPSDVQKSFITDDGGRTWQELPVALKRIRQGLQTGILLASGPNNFYKSIDGYHWVNTNSPVNGGVCDINPFNNAHLIVTGYMKDLSISIDTGKTWKSLKSRSSLQSESKFYSTANLFDGVQEIAFDPHFKNRIWMGNWFFWAYTDSCYNSENEINQKVQWNTRLKGYEEMSACGIGGISSPSGNSLVHLTYADNGGIRITDFERFPENRDVTNGTKGNHVGIDYCGSDNDFLVCTSMEHWWDPGWGYFSTNNGQTWSAFKKNPQENIFEDGKLYSSTGNIAVSATKNHGGWPAIVRGNINPYYSHDGGVTWTKSICDGNFIIPSKLSETDNVLISDKITADKFYYLGFPPSSWTKKNLYISTDGGISFQLAKQNLPNASKIAVNPWVDGDLWIGENGTNLMHSKDNGKTWTTIPEISKTVAFGLGKGNKPDSVSVYVMGIMNNIRGIFRSDDQGKSWVNISDPANGYGMMEYRLIGDNKVWGRMYLSMTSTGAFFGEPTDIECQPAQDLKVVSGNNKVIIEWENSSGTKTNYLFRSESETGSFELIDSISGVSYVDKAVVNEMNYYYKLQAVGYNNQTEPIGPVLARPSELYPPTEVNGLLAFNWYDKNLSMNVVKLSWSRNPTDEVITAYKVWRKTENTDFIEIGSASNPAVTFADMLVDDGQLYHYAVTAVNANGTGKMSEIVDLKYSNKIATSLSNYKYYFSENMLQFERPMNFSIYNILGIEVGKYENAHFVNTSNLGNGLLIVKFSNGQTMKIFNTK
jgi:xyloglucan-specific exo-beta-1,4-glucanase